MKDRFRQCQMRPWPAVRVLVPIAGPLAHPDLNCATCFDPVRDPRGDFAFEPSGSPRSKLHWCREVALACKCVDGTPRQTDAFANVTQAKDCLRWWKGYQHGLTPSIKEQ